MVTEYIVTFVKRKLYRRPKKNKMVNKKIMTSNNFSGLNNYEHVLEFKKLAEHKEGRIYETNFIKAVSKIFGNKNILLETQIAAHLKNEGETWDEINKLRGVDAVILTENNLYAIQIKIGSSVRGTRDVDPFVRTLNRLYTKSLIPNSIFNGYMIVPVWYTSSKMDFRAFTKLQKNNIYIFINFNWNVDIEQCELFNNFIKTVLL